MSVILIHFNNALLRTPTAEWGYTAKVGYLSPPSGGEQKEKATVWLFLEAKSSAQGAEGASYDCDAQRLCDRTGQRVGGEPAHVKTARVLHLRHPFCRLLLPASSVGRPSSRRRAKLPPLPTLARGGSHRQRTQMIHHSLSKESTPKGASFAALRNLCLQLARQKLSEAGDEGENSPVNCFRPRSHENRELKKGLCPDTQRPYFRKGTLPDQSVRRSGRPTDNEVSKKASQRMPFCGRAIYAHEITI